MRPAALRQVHSDRSLFSRQIFSLARGLLDEEDRLEVPDLALFTLWVEAVAQHYGPGSRFLDVTRSIASHSGLAFMSLTLT